MQWMWFAVTGCGSLFILWLLLHIKTSRPDGSILKKVHPYRILMQHIMPTRAESIVFYDMDIDAEQLLQYIEETREQFHTDITHCLIAAVVHAIQETPELNRFPSGRRLYQRKGIWVTFSMKRKKGNKKAKMATVKKEFPQDTDFQKLCNILHEEIQEQRSDKVTFHDKEYKLLTALPQPFLRIGVAFVRWLDYFNLLPGSFIHGDGMYASAFIANLGSIKMHSAYHHLYEWGNCPLFVMAGKIEERPVVVDGQVQVRTQLPLRITYDERIDDGLTANAGLQTLKRVLEDPYTHFGRLAEEKDAS